ncbi:MAG: trehalose-phosphatase [Deltaproteobacteria bacterium]|nr:trehalose-phosphatase [Deltaproteobacteria bacterium]
MDAVIFDLDGVVTKTAAVHAAAWKKTFDAVLTLWARNHDSEIKPFDRDRDYRLYVDGKSREEGIRSFLKSRSINLPEGRPEDAPGWGTVHAVGNMKNRLFQENLEQDGVEPYSTTLDFIHQLKGLGIRTAVVSASKNCAMVMERAGIQEFFDVRVDGVDAARLGILGKPDPDIFLEATHRLRVEPRRAAVIEDAIAGVRAARAGEFGLVIGVSRDGDPEKLLAYGADLAVNDLSEIDIDGEEADRSGVIKELPSALDQFDQIKDRLKNRQPVVFLDYDGTLTPIVATPDQAVLNEDMRSALLTLSRSCAVGIISGRGLADIRRLVGIDDLVYAGSHGFEIAGPGNIRPENSEALSFMPLLDQAEGELRAKLAPIEGTLVERKKLGIAAHYRLVDSENVPAVEAAVDDMVVKHRKLRKAFGKKVFELQPAMDWNKGKALQFLLRSLKLDREDILPFYIGDDVTDEDAFKVLIEKGCGIVVWDRPFPTAAGYYLKNPDEVRRFLLLLAEER